MVTTPSSNGFYCKFPRLGASVLAVLLSATCAAEAGTWSFRPWKNDGDLPRPDPGMVSHAVAFGVFTEPPAPAPFEITKKTSGEKWAVWRHPNHTSDVGVADFKEGLVNIGQEGDLLLRGRIQQTGRDGGLALELSGLEPGRNYTLAIFGLRYGFFNPPTKLLIKACASDAPGQPEVLDIQGGKYRRFLVCDYVAPADGQINFSFECDESNQDAWSVLFSSFLNCRTD